MRNKNAKISDPNKFISCAGDQYQVQYKPVVKNGVTNLVEDGKIDIKEYINSFKEKTDMAYILKQLRLGDTSVLNARKALYGDFTEMPTTMQEFQQRMIDGQRAFEQLPLDIRNQYDHNMWNWLNDIGSAEWMNIMKPVMDNDIVQPSESEVTVSA